MAAKLILAPTEYEAWQRAEFWARVDQSGGLDACWPWRYGRNKAGYGQALYGAEKIQAHRLAYALAKQPIPAGMIILHSCDNPPCCNPAHLSIGTHGDNARDKLAKGRWKYPHKGETHPRAKLSDAAVKEIRTEYADGVPPVEIRRRHKISRGYLWKLVAVQYRTNP